MLVHIGIAVCITLSIYALPRIIRSGVTNTQITVPLFLMWLIPTTIWITFFLNYFGI